ncbi:MAG: hypothetical protein J6D25_02805, partial [Eggerthellaceae bacterium]|nr:hypothetical protein [Eggerthellaceae bacterium]
CFVSGRADEMASLEFIGRAEEAGVELAYPVHILKDVFYLVQRGMKSQARLHGSCTEQGFLAIRRAAWGCIENMREHATAIGADESDAWLACKYRPLSEDLEDNFVLAAAERAKADFIVTGDEGLIRKATVVAYTPQDALKYLEAIGRQ